MNADVSALHWRPETCLRPFCDSPNYQYINLKGSNDNCEPSAVSVSRHLGQFVNLLILTVPLWLPRNVLQHLNF